MDIGLRRIDRKRVAVEFLRLVEPVLHAADNAHELQGLRICRLGGKKRREEAFRLEGLAPVEMRERLSNRIGKDAWCTHRVDQSRG